MQVTPDRQPREEFFYVGCTGARSAIPAGLTGNTYHALEA